MSKAHEYHMNIIKHRKIFICISLALILATIILSTFRAKLDVSFSGGTMITYTYDGDAEAVQVKELASKISAVAGKDVTIDITSDMASTKSNIVVTIAGHDSLPEAKITEMNKTVTDYYKDSDTVKNISTGTTNNVDPVMGTEFFIKCMVAVGVAFLLIVLYVALRFRKIGGWSAGVMAIYALLNDICMVFCTFLICGYTLDSNFIAAVLTILGYSVNDTIVIYDRIRENEGIYGKRMGTGEMVNLSINQTFFRTLNTTITTVLAMLIVTIVALIFNIDSIMRFSIPLIVGLISGCFSSNCIAPGLWVSWINHKEKIKAGKKARA